MVKIPTLILMQRKGVEKQCKCHEEKLKKNQDETDKN